MADGNEPFLSNVFGFGFYNFRKEGLVLRDIINGELEAINPCYCKLPLMSEPSMNFYFVKFR